MHELVVKLVSVLRAMWLRRWYGIGVAWLVGVAGWLWAYLTPDEYEASARVYIDTQTMLKPLMSGLTVAPNMEQIVSMMTRTLISRPNMEKVARMVDLDVRAKTPKEMEALLDGLARDIKLNAARGADLYTITYRHRDPQVAKRVVQSLLTILVEGSLGTKRKDTDAARRFIEDQLRNYEEKLVAAEKALKEFKQKHVGLMPGEGGDYFTKLANAQQALAEAQLALREAESRRDQLKRQLADEEPTVKGEVPQATANPEIDARIQEQQKRLDQLRLVYTEQHPDVVATKRLIAQLEQQKQEEAKKRKPSAAGAGASANPFYQQLGIALAEAEANVASLRARVGELSGRYNQLKTAVNMLPQVEAELTQLTRDYEVHRANYEQLLKRRESAEISEQMESKTDVIDFRVVDPPRTSGKPVYPNRPLFVSLVFLAALAAGVAASFLVSQLVPVVPDRAALRAVADHPVLGSVSMVWSPRQKRSRRRGLLAYLGTVGALLGAYGTLIAALFVGRAA